MAENKPGTAVEKAKKTWADVLAEQLPAFREVLPNVGITAEQVLKDYTMAMRKNPTLKQCTSQSVIATIMEACELGLSLAPTLRQAAPVPFKNKRGDTECTLIIEYPGYITLMKRTGEVTDVKAYVVWDNEPFEMKAGSNPYIDHTQLPPDKRGKNVVGAYAVVLYANGTTTYEWMWLEELLAVKARAPGAKMADSPWNHPVDVLEMYKKCPIRRIAKRSPLSPNNVSLIKAATIDERNELGLGFRDMIPGDDPEPLKGEPPKGMVESVQPANAEEQSGPTPAEKKEEPARTSNETEKQEPPKKQDPPKTNGKAPEKKEAKYPPADCPKAAVLDGQKCRHFDMKEETCADLGPCMFKIVATSK